MYDPVCDVDGKSHANECLLRVESCKARRMINMAKQRPCGNAFVLPASSLL